LCTPILVKIGDFGLVKEYTSQTMTLDPSTPLYLAPELQRILGRKRSRYDCKIDIFSFGVILFELCTGIMTTEIGNELIENHPDLPLIHLIPHEFVELITRCRSENPQIRPSSIELVQYFKTAIIARPNIDVEINPEIEREKERVERQTRERVEREIEAREREIETREREIETRERVERERVEREIEEREREIEAREREIEAREREIETREREKETRERVERERVERERVEREIEAREREIKETSQRKCRNCASVFTNNEQNNCRFHNVLSLN